ncbi:MAG: hypothetical protein NTZ69_14440 [Bacteroidia bacterium]|nr:hypothetical protein [Bacteroidia bacterium]
MSIVQTFVIIVAAQSLFDSFEKSVIGKWCDEAICLYNFASMRKEKIQQLIATIARGKGLEYLAETLMD